MSENLLIRELTYHRTYLLKNLLVCLGSNEVSPEVPIQVLIVHLLLQEFNNCAVRKVAKNAGGFARDLLLVFLFSSTNLNCADLLPKILPNYEAICYFYPERRFQLMCYKSYQCFKQMQCSTVFTVCTVILSSVAILYFEYSRKIYFNIVQYVRCTVHPIKNCEYF